MVMDKGYGPGTAKENCSVISWENLDCAKGILATGYLANGRNIYKYYL